MWIKTMANTYVMAEKVQFCDSGRAIVHLPNQQRVFVEGAAADELRLMLEERSVTPTWLAERNETLRMESLTRKAG